GLVPWEAWCFDAFQFAVRGRLPHEFLAHVIHGCQQVMPVTMINERAGKHRTINDCRGVTGNRDWTTMCFQRFHLLVHICLRSDRAAYYIEEWTNFKHPLPVNRQAGIK
ncbi:MAG: hypothetical protein R3318_01530, partial [Gammaproteobacteria bacterium]|nr:hypothetical protein [Gammaproteobacteria bacterium]